MRLSTVSSLGLFLLFYIIYFIKKEDHMAQRRGGRRRFSARLQHRQSSLHRYNFNFTQNQQ